VRDRTRAQGGRLWRHQLLHALEERLEGRREPPDVDVVCRHAPTLRPTAAGCSELNDWHHANA
jgi:hypothetical protein